MNIALIKYMLLDNMPSTIGIILVSIGPFLHLLFDVPLPPWMVWCAILAYVCAIISYFISYIEYTSKDVGRP